MVTIQIDQPHCLGLSGARQRFTELEAEFSQRFGVSVTWQNNNNDAQFSGKGFSGTLQVSPDRVTLKLKLGLLARPFAGKIERAMREQMAKLLA